MWELIYWDGLRDMWYIVGWKLGNKLGTGEYSPIMTQLLTAKQKWLDR